VSSSNLSMEPELRKELPEDMYKFTKKLKKASSLIRMISPDYIFAPVAGAVPLVDMLYIVDRKFPLNDVEYLPNSSRFRNRTELMERWYKNFYKEKNISSKTKIICLDEVLSGSSSVVGYRQFLNSINNLAKEKSREFTNEVEAYDYHLKRLRKNIDYKIVGFSEQGYDRNPSFRKLITKGIARTVDFKEIPTIDNVAMNTIRFKEDGKNIQGRVVYSPEVERFDITPQYLNLLQSIASHVGADPRNVSPTNFSKIQEGMYRSLN